MLSEARIVHTHVIIALKWSPYLEAAKGKTYWGKGFEWTCKMLISMFFQECNCFLILNIYWGVRVADTGHVAEQTKDPFEKITEALMDVCFRIYVCVREVCVESVCVMVRVGGIQALTTKQQNSWGSQTLTFCHVIAIVKLYERILFVPCISERKLAHYLGPPKPPFIYSFLFITSSLRRIHQVRGNTVPSLRVGSHSPCPSPAHGPPLCTALDHTGEWWPPQPSPSCRRLGGLWASREPGLHLAHPTFSECRTQMLLGQWHFAKWRQIPVNP